MKPVSSVVARSLASGESLAGARSEAALARSSEVASARVRQTAADLGRWSVRVRGDPLLFTGARGMDAGWNAIAWAHPPLGLAT